MINLKIIIDPELSTLFKNLRGWDYEELKKDIEINGIRIPIEVADDGTLIEGHQRFRIWKELGRDPADIPKNVKHYDSREEMKDAAITLNILRRHLNNAQRAWIALKYYLPEEKEKAEKRVGGRPKKGKKPPLTSEEVSGEAYKIAAKKVGLGKDTLRKAERVFEEATPEVVERVLKGKTSLSHASTKVVRKKKHENPPSLPEGIFDVIYADPPWKYYLPLRGAPDVHYETMSTEDICNLTVEGISIQEKIADDAILFLWATNPQLKVAFEVIEAWDFSYLTNLVWTKDKWGTGHYLRGQHELLLIAKRGKIPPPVEEVRPSSILQAPVREHSRKPDEVYDIIETLYPNRKYLELFARNGREKWASWGLETTSPPQNDQNQTVDYPNYGIVSSEEV